MDEGVRLAKRVAEMLTCSRREAEQVITGGWVQVDGLVVDEPAHRVANEKIEIHSAAQRGKVPLLSVLLHKNSDMSCNSNSRKSVWQALAPDNRSSHDRSGIRLTPRLQKLLQCAAGLEDAASGLVVLSDDPRVLRKLADQRQPLEHEMLAEVSGAVSPDQLHQLCPVGLRTSISSQNAQQTGLRMAFKGYLPGYAVDVLRAANLSVLSLKRVRLGRVVLAPLQAGQWRALMPYERF